MPKPEKGSSYLRTGRTSVPGAEYLITTCTFERQWGLAQATLLAAMHRELESMRRENVWNARAFTLMPDHLHLFVTLGEELELSRAVARMKSKLSPVLKQNALGWQSGYHDHRLRSKESPEPFFRYIFLNPYQAGLIETGENWHHTWFQPEDWVWFESLTDEGLPLPEWLADLP